MLLYGALFLGYRSFYIRLGASPEELGIGNAYVLPRAVGFIVLILLLSAPLLGIWWAGHYVPGLLRAEEGGDKGARRRVLLLIAVVGAIAGLFIGVLFGALTSPNVVQDTLVLLLVSAVGTGLWKAAGASSGELSRRVALAGAGVLIVLLPTIAIVQRGNALAREALRGQAVDAFDLFGVPILDVSAVPVSITWIGGATDAPALFSDTSGTVDALLIGTAGGTALFLPMTDRRLARAPSAQVLIQDR